MSTVMRARRTFLCPFFLCGLAVLVAGCSPDRRDADASMCISKAQQEAPAPAGQSQEEMHDAIGAMVGDCMKELGYRHEMTDEKCIDDVDFNASCYVHRR